MSCAAPARVIPLRPPANDDPATWAAFYVSLGWRVLPVEPRGKRPLVALVARGVLDASNDVETVARWWKDRPDANIGVACGDGLAVLDTDHRNGGAQTLHDLVMTHNPPAGPFVCTGGGIHHYFRVPPGRNLRGTLGPGLDVKTSGYVVAPPSAHPSGHVYRWARGYDPVATRGLPELPASVLDVLDPPRPARPAAPRPRGGRVDGATPYGRAAFEALLREIEAATEGERHPAVYRCAVRAGELALAGHLDAGGAFDAIATTALAAVAGEGRDREVLRTIADGFQHARRGSRAS